MGEKELNSFTKKDLISLVLQLLKEGNIAEVVKENLLQKKEIATLIKKLNNMEEKLSYAYEKIKELEDRISKDSHNSSKPSSSDGFKKPIRTKSLRKKSGKKPGGQKGHQGVTLQKEENPDHIVSHGVDECQNCRCNLKETQPCHTEKHQVFDIPPMNIEVTEHQAKWKHCPKCGKLNKAKFPKEAQNEVQYGNRLKAMVNYLMCYQLIPYERTKEIFQDLFKRSPSPGSFYNMTEECFNHLEKTEEQIMQQIIDSYVGNFDESGMRINNKLSWLHNASTKELTHYAVHAKRGNEAMNDIGILPNFRGRAIHDFWKCYFHYLCKHGLCNAHHLRTLVYIYETEEAEWAKDITACLLEIKEMVDQEKLTTDQLAPEMITFFEKKYDDIIQEGYEFYKKQKPPPSQKKKRGRKKQSTGKNLLDRLDERREEVLAFMYDFRVPFDNNLAERDIRMIKLRMKISGCFRSEKGAEFFCRIRGYISTARKQGINVYEALYNVFIDTPCIPSLMGAE